MLPYQEVLKHLSPLGHFPSSSPSISISAGPQMYNRAWDPPLRQQRTHALRALLYSQHSVAFTETRKQQRHDRETPKPSERQDTERHGHERAGTKSVPGSMGRRVKPILWTYFQAGGIPCLWLSLAMLLNVLIIPAKLVFLVRNFIDTLISSNEDTLPTLKCRGGNSTRYAAC